MLAGPGLSNLVKLPITDGPSACRIAITRLPTDGVSPAGTWDDDPTSPTFQTYAHLLVAFPTSGANAVVDNSGAVPPLIEFDSPGIVVFPPKCSQVSVIGGLGLYGVMAESVPIIREGYAPRERRLLRMLEARDSFTVPSGHGGIGTLDTTAALDNVSDGGTLLLSSAQSFPIIPGTVLQNPNAFAVLVWTSFDA